MIQNRNKEAIFHYFGRNHSFMIFLRIKDFSYKKVVLFILVQTLPLLSIAQEYDHAVNGVVEVVWWLLALFFIVLSIVIQLVNVFVNNKSLHRVCKAITVLYSLLGIYVSNLPYLEKMGLWFLGLFGFGIVLLTFKTKRLRRNK